MEQRRSSRARGHKHTNSTSSIISNTILPAPLHRSASSGSIGQLNTNSENAPIPFNPTSKAIVSPPESNRRPSASHSRSNSIREGLGNLNRWSASTSSSTHTRSKSNSFSRYIGLGSQASPTSPKKLQKQQSTNNIDRATAYPSAGNTVNPVSTITPQLPPIVTLPTLQQAVDSSQSPGFLSATNETAFDFLAKLETPPRARSVGATDNLGQSPRAPETPSRRPRRQEDGAARRGHTRQRSQASSAGTFSSEQSRERHSKQPSQKAMLSKALQKANTAVLLDNAQNFEGAIHAYSEACSLLQQVMQRSSGEDDKRKLEAIVSRFLEVIHMMFC